jgi:hypothetical protein
MKTTHNGQGGGKPTIVGQRGLSRLRENQWNERPHNLSIGQEGPTSKWIKNKLIRK